MSLAFLAKKTWHVTNYANQEAVWKAEEVRAAEDRKLEAWKKKREEERQIMELQRLQQESGQGQGGSGGQSQERVDFLYEQHTTRKEEYLLGKPVDIRPDESEIKRVEHLPGASFLAGGQNNLSSMANEEFNKMNNDPLMQMRAEEQKALQRILANPLKMKAIKTAVDVQRQAIESADLDQRREHKDDKKHKHKRKEHKDRKHKHHKEHNKDRHQQRRKDSDDDSDDPNAPPKHSGSKCNESSSATPAAGDGGDMFSAKVRKAEYGLQLYSGGEKLRHEVGRVDDFAPSECFSGTRPGYVFRSGDKGLGYYADIHDGVPVRPLGAKPKLVVPEPLRGRPGYGGSERGGVRARGVGSGGAPPSAAEKAERLVRMMADADAHEGGRRKRVRSDERGAKPEATQATGMEEPCDERRPAFVRDVASSVYGDGGASVADRIGQQRHYAQRGSGAEH